MEPPRIKKERAKELMAQRCYLRAADHKYNMGRDKEESPKQDEMEKNCGCPMSPYGMKWNKSSHKVLNCHSGYFLYIKTTLNMAVSEFCYGIHF